MAEHICENVYRIDIPLTGNPLKNLNSYLIMGQGQERSLLIDTGFHWDVCREAMERQLQELEVDRSRMDIFCTHLHSDHSGLASELIRPGRDPREDMPKPVLRSDVLEMKDLQPGMILKGTVRNVIDFGAFVDIGVHQDGLVHISRMKKGKYVKHPLEVVSVGDVVEVKVVSVDMEKKRIALSMIL